VDAAYCGDIEPDGCENLFTLQEHVYNKNEKLYMAVREQIPIQEK